MKNIFRLKNESLTEFANRLASFHDYQNTKSTKKDKGQFFTPSSVAKFMAELSNISKESISILDPGTGIGILSVALIEKITNKGKVKKINLVCYETDNRVLPLLKLLLEETKKSLHKKVSFDYAIVEKDFVKSNANILTENLDAYSKPDKPSFDVIISNPPYFKLNKNDLQIAKFKDIVSGQPNIYFLFMAISAKLLNAEGEMIFITPRSFCSGLYYNKFRKWLIKKVNFENIHLFDSRKELFSTENVLQENIITKFTKKETDSVYISKTFNGTFSERQIISVSKKDVVYKSNGYIFFRIPSNQEELRVIRELDKLPYNFYKLGVKISTGKVVAFRNKEHLQKSIANNSIPLLWMHNIKNGRIQWPINKKNKAIAIKNSAVTKWLFSETGNYLVLKRFTTKEQKRRFVTACIFKEDFEKYGYFALDNMVNYIYRPNHPLSKNQIKGIAKYLDLPIVDLYFRILNGHTQVNANEVYALPFPSLEYLEAFGENESKTTNMLNIKAKEMNVQLHNKQIVEILHA
ncbi:MAG: N-6 DNA methylase [Candidatus Aenigmarchaeota archaeon]|nr:N-6 DNA methylase [Candidatus Aenigmarchaeota archaeon]